MRKLVLFIAAIISTSLTSLRAQTPVCEPNMDFELGDYTNWHLYIGTCCPVSTPTLTTTPSASYFSITSGTANDPCCAFPVVGNGIHSLKVGSLGGSSEASKARYYVHVPATTSNYNLVYRYAFHVDLGGHPVAQEARMEVNVFDSATGTAVPYASFSSLSSPLTGVYYGTGACSSTECKAWSTQTIDLSGYGGKTVVIDFIASDCALGSHYGYGYVDMSCGLFAISSVANCSSVNLAAPSGFASYDWYDSATFSTFYGSTANISFAPPVSIQHYAVIVTPNPGFGPPDTLYTTIYPVCSGVPVSGTIVSSAPAACATSAFTLTATGYTTGIFYQWQSSSDSLTWTDIAGATSGTYTCPGISTTTYFRIKDSCCTSGLSAASAGIKVTYAPCCTGTPVAGNATASTSYCSSCSLTLDLAAFTYQPGMNFQWQYSLDSLSWNNMPGATNMPYTFTPWGTYYYRCLVTCSYSGLSANAGGVKVLFQYRITQDTVTNNIGGICPAAGPEFYVKINGVSPLLTLKTYYGDGTADSVPVTAAVNYSYSIRNHIYGVSGAYTVKHVIYWNNHPQDSVKYTYLYQHCNMLHVALYKDLNGNCVKDIGEANTASKIYVQVDSNGIAVDTMSATSGMYYRSYGTDGTVYTFRTINTPLQTTCPLSGFLNDTINASGSYLVKYFGLECVPGSTFDLYEHLVIPGTGRHSQSGSIYIRNNFCSTVNATVTLHFSPKYFYLFADPPATSHVDNSITWNILLSASNPTLTQLTYSVDRPLPWLMVGDSVHSSISIIPTSGDIDITNNTETRIDTVRASFDPNFVEVTPPGCFRRDTTLEYTIHFENTGNDTAHNIHVMDTLSANLDVNSLQIVLASHEMNVAVYKDGGYNIVKFDFPNIKLLDSSHHFLCDGAVIYTINTMPGLADGAEIYNRAGIYFDENEVIMTNTVENIKGCPPVGVTNIEKGYRAEIYPNPATSELTIKMDAGAYSSFVITNNVGQELIQQPLLGSVYKADIRSLAPGLYYITLRGENGTTVRKFVKM